MPENTIFSKYHPCVFDELLIKGESYMPREPDDAGDFLEQQIVSSIDSQSSDQFMGLLEIARETGISLRMDFNTEGRDGLFDKEQLFAVWEKEDVRALIERLSRCL